MCMHVPYLLNSHKRSKQRKKTKDNAHSFSMIVNKYSGVYVPEEGIGSTAKFLIDMYIDLIILNPDVFKCLKLKQV